MQIMESCFWKVTASKSSKPQELYKSSFDYMFTMPILEGFMKLFFLAQIFFFFVFLGPHSRHMQIPRLGVNLELPAYTTVTTMQDPSLIFDLHHNSRQLPILNPLSKVRDQTHILVGFLNCWAMTGTPAGTILIITGEALQVLGR